MAAAPRLDGRSSSREQWAQSHRSGTTILGRLGHSSAGGFQMGGGGGNGAVMGGQNGLPANYVCRRCGAYREHFIKDCPANVCNRCGQMGHIATACTAAASATNLPPEGYVCRRCGANRQHFIRDCPTNVCNRCTVVWVISRRPAINAAAAGAAGQRCSTSPDE